MEHKKISYLLIGAGVLAALGGGFLFFIDAPMAALRYRSALPELSYLMIPGLVFLWFIGILYGTAMINYFLICVRIGKNRSFSRENASGLSRIAALLLGAGLIWLLGIPFGLLLRLRLGVWSLAFLLAAAASAAMGALAWGLAKLLRRAVEMKEENDLTV